MIMSAKINEVLVPFDNSPNSKRALDYALSIAEMSEAKITLVYVISYHGAVAKIIGPYKGTLIKHVTKFLENAKDLASSRGIASDFKVLYGNIAEEILGFTKTKRFDLIVIGRRGSSKESGPLLGSVSNALVHSSKIPTLVVA